MARISLWRRLFSFDRALAKRSSSAVGAVFPSAPSPPESTSSGFFAGAAFFFALGRKFFDFDSLNVLCVRAKIVHIDLEAQT